MRASSESVFSVTTINTILAHFHAHASHPPKGSQRTPPLTTTTAMAPVAASSKKGFLLALAEEGEAAMSRLLNRKHKAAITKRKTRKGEATREYGLRKIVSRGISVALSAYGMAKKTAGLGGVQGLVADALVKTTGALLGKQNTHHVGTSIATGWNIKYEVVREDDRRSLSLSFTETPEGCEGREFQSRLEFKSPADDFIRVPGEGENRRVEGNSVHRQRKRPCSRSTVQPDAKSSFSPGASATGRTASTPQLPPPVLPLQHSAHRAFIKPKTEQGTTSEFETIPLSSPQAETQLNRLKTEMIKQEVPY